MSNIANRQNEYEERYSQMLLEQKRELKCINLHQLLIDYLTKEKTILRPKQIKALEIILLAPHGQGFSATATGKTKVEILKCLNELLQIQDKGEKGVAVLASHRISLNIQLLKQLIKIADAINIAFDVLTVASDGIDEQDVCIFREGMGDLSHWCAVDRTTKIDEIAKKVENSKKINRHVLVVVTYHSFDRLQKISKIDIVCCDEAHEATERDKFENVKLVMNKGIIKKILFFTATPVHGCNGRGQDNVDIFGPELYSFSPREAIDDGDILPPLILRAIVKGGNSLSAIVKSCYVEVRKKWQEMSGIPVRMLIAHDSVDKMIELELNRSYREWARTNGIDTVSFSCKGFFINGCECDRKKAFKAAEEKTNTPLILSNFDILTTGIDMPNVNAVLALRELNLVKEQQFLGRAARVTPSDRKLLEVLNVKSFIDNDLTVVLNPLMEKPCYFVIVPQLADQSNQNEEEVIKRIREAYHIEPFVRDIREVSTSHILEEADIPYQLELTKVENENKTKLFFEFEAYKVESLLDPKLSEEEKEERKNQVCKMLEEIFDEMIEEQK